MGWTQVIAASPPTIFQVRQPLFRPATFTSQVGIVSGEGPRSYGAPFCAFPQVASASSGRGPRPGPILVYELAISAGWTRTHCLTLPDARRRSYRRRKLLLRAPRSKRLRRLPVLRSRREGNVSSGIGTPRSGSSLAPVQKRTSTGVPAAGLPVRSVHPGSR